MNTISVFMLQIFQSLLLIAIAPLLMGWIGQMQAWLTNRTGAGILQPYRKLHKLFLKEVVVATNASWLFRAAPYIYFSALCLTTALIPVLSTLLPMSAAADVIVLVGIFTFARIFLALAAMDIGTAFGSMGSRREVLVAFLTEPALLMVFFSIALQSQSTSLNMIVSSHLSHPLILNPSFAFTAIAFFMILLAENARIPIDNSRTHLELTMIHEAMILEYSGRYLGLIEWARCLKLINYFALGIALFFPWGIAETLSISTVPLAICSLVFKLFLFSTFIALFEIITTKIRIFQVPEFLTVAFLLAILGVLTQLLVME